MAEPFEIDPDSKNPTGLQFHMEEYRHKTDARKVKRYESILEEAMSELIARRERDARAGGRRQGKVGFNS